MAQEEFQVRVCTEYGFPEEIGDLVQEWAKECWSNACARLEHFTMMTEDLYIMVRQISIQGFLIPHSTIDPKMYFYNSWLCQGQGCATCSSSLQLSGD